MSFLLALATSANITITATIVSGCSSNVTSYLVDAEAPQEDLYLTCNRGNRVAVRIDGDNFMQQASFNAHNVHAFEQGGTIRIPLPTATRGMFVSLPRVSRPPRTITIEVQ